MKARLFLLLAALSCSCLSGCTRVRHMKEVSQVSYSEESGTILPELQLYEQVVITWDKATLHRNGRTPDTKVNVGKWEIPLDAQAVQALFAGLEAIDTAAIRKIEPAELELGGATKRYRIVYAGGETFDLAYGGGITYTNGRLIAAPIDAFVERLAFPAGAALQYDFSADQP